MKDVVVCRCKHAPIGRHGGVLAKGGDISLGHPLGMSVAQIAATAARRIVVSGAKSALVTLCVGVGQGFVLALHAM
jgi:acetyl-CoA acetyltransferase